MARTQTVYEWRVNVRDEHGDCFNIDFFDTYDEALSALWSTPMAADIELCRVVGDQDDGVHYIDYATVEDGKLPEFFDYCSIRVTKAHHAEVARAHKAA